MSASYKKELSKQAEARIAAAGGSLRKLAESHRREAGAAMREAAQNIAPRAPRMVAPPDPRRRRLPFDRPESFSGGIGGLNTDLINEPSVSNAPVIKPAFPNFNGNILALAQYCRANPQAIAEHQGDSPVEDLPDMDRTLQRVKPKMTFDEGYHDSKTSSVNSYISQVNSDPRVQASLSRLYQKDMVGRRLLEFAMDNNVTIRHGEVRSDSPGIETRIRTTNCGPVQGGRSVRCDNIIEIIVDEDKLKSFNIDINDTELMAYLLGHELAHPRYGYKLANEQLFPAGEYWLEDTFEPEFLKQFPPEIGERSKDFLDGRTFVEKSPANGLTANILVDGLEYLVDTQRKPRLYDPDGIPWWKRGERDETP